MRTITTTLYGTLQGRIWWPQVECCKDITVNLTNEGNRFHKEPWENRARPCLPRLIDHVLMEHAGDFQSAVRLTDDSYIEVESKWRTATGAIRRTRRWPITFFPSIADQIVERTVFPEYED